MSRGIPRVLKLPAARALRRALKDAFPGRQLHQAGVIAIAAALGGISLLAQQQLARQHNLQRLQRELVSSELKEQAAELKERTAHWARDLQLWQSREGATPLESFWSLYPAPPALVMEALLVTPSGQLLAKPRRFLNGSSSDSTPAELPPTLLNGQRNPQLLSWGSTVVLAASAPVSWPPGAQARLVFLESLEPTLDAVGEILRAEGHLHVHLHPATESAADNPEPTEWTVIPQPAGLTEDSLSLHQEAARPLRRLLLAEAGRFLLVEGLVLILLTAVRARLGLRERRQRLQFRQRQRHQWLAQRSSIRRDPLTDLLSLEGLVTELAGLRRRYSAFELAVLVIDLDRFSLLNNQGGRRLGDAALQAWAQLLLQLVPPSALVARKQGDRFAVALLGTSRSMLEAELKTLSERLSRVELTVQGQSLLITSRCGAYHLDPHESNLSEAIYRAGFACTMAKRQQMRLMIHGSDRSGEQSYLELQQRHQQLHQAISRQQLLAYGQPIWELGPAGWTPIHIEWLCRLPDPEGGPDQWSEQFIRAAQFWGTEARLDQAMLQLCCAEWAALRQRRGVLPAAMTYALNVTPASLQDPDFAQQLLAVLQHHDLPPDQLCLEITEQAAISNLAQVREVMRQLQPAGVKLALDDFGAGMTSLSELQTLPLDMVKADRCLVTNLVNHADPKAQSISRAVFRFLLELEQQLGFALIAEGVETPAMLEQLQQLGVRRVQGYLLARPQPFATLDLSSPPALLPAP